MSPLYVRSKVCIAPFQLPSKVCIAPHMDGSHADFALQLERRHSFNDQIGAKNACFANGQRELFKTTTILGVYMIYVTTFENVNILRESTFKDFKSF